MACKITSGSICLIMVMILSLTITSHSVTNEIPCNQALAALGPCMAYLTGKAMAPPPYCCTAVGMINQRADTTGNRRTLCGCFKAAAKAGGVITDRAARLPKLCHVDVKVPINPNIDCNRIPAY